ncbi:hypothetical protein VTN77DRAFT_1956 [Rasamsonia byssochlamydoides]|uniref:uncharacterized protein n=1 Tax=Rasamsonia byssochlamydoides TaxID=89139 RepID=UPI00374220D5
MAARCWAVIGLRGVYMAHYWEVYALMASDDVTPGSESLTNFQEKVLNAITGQGTQDANTLGPAIDWNLFNQPGDNTRVIIMTPYADTKEGPIKYENKINLIINLLQTNIPGAQVRIRGYARLNY